MGRAQELHATSEFLSKILNLECYIPTACPFCLPLECKDGDLSHPQGPTRFSQGWGYREHLLCLTVPGFCTRCRDLPFPHVVTSSETPWDTDEVAF